MGNSNRTCIYSFGDNGVTATVSPSGRLLRMSRHFKGEKFGYCVDHWSIPEPYMVVDRINTFLSSADDPDHNIGFYPDQDSWTFDVDDISVDFINDRWPVFDFTKDIRSEEKVCRIQYSVSDDVVYQTFEYSNDRPPPMAFMSSLLIRQLEFSDGSNKINGDKESEDRYETRLLDEGKCIKRLHKLQQGGNKHAALFVYAFSDNKALNFEEVTKNNHVGSKGNSDMEEQGEKVEGKGDKEGEGNAGITYYRISADNKFPEATKVTLVYFLSLETGELGSLRPLTSTTAPKFVNINTAEERRFTLDDGLNVALRRNLEYILSVCCIPVYFDPGDENDFAIALTCGDVDSHRVATAASFYCFQFLLMALRHFVSSCGHNKESDSETATCNICCIVKRIRKALEGHLKWVFGEKYRNVASSPSCPHTWVNGQEIDGWKENQYLSSDSLVDAPFQLIKAGDYKQYDSEWEVPEAAKRAVKTWVEELDPKNKLGCYAFPHDIEEPTHSFYLTDHVLIWRAAKSAELLGLKSELSVAIAQEDGYQTKKKARKRDYSPSRIQNQILKLFAAENPASKKRMLTISRSPRHVQFLLRTRDTALFHAMDSHLFDKPGAMVDHTGDEWHNKIEIWQSLVDCQPLHEDNEDTLWDKPLRFALSVIMACKGKSMNSRSPIEMHKHGIAVLLESKWPNGLFPGQLDSDGEPAIYSDELKRDRYWSNSFEIPYLLWKYGECPSEPEPVAVTSGIVSNLASDPAGPQNALFEYQKNLKGFNYANVGSMKRTFPWNNVVDQTNIVQLSDEWLYDVPDFFKEEEASGRWAIPLFDLHLPPIPRPFSGAVIDVPRLKDEKKTPPELDKMMTYVYKRDELKRLMEKRRLPDNAKKRLCVLFAADPEANMPYPQTDSEVFNLLNFTARHKSYDKSFFEHTAAETNKWTTEIHLSFNALGESFQKPSEESSKTERATETKIDLDKLVSLVTDVGCRRLERVVMSLRFDGDFFNRYWTCYLLDCDPQWGGDEDIFMSSIKSMLHNKGREGRIRLEDKREPWRQRRILELLIFQRMVDRMHHCTEEILEDSKSIAKEDAVRWTYGISNVQGYCAKDYDISRRDINVCQEQFRAHQQRLQTVEQDIAENMEQIGLWLKREAERQTERPRWSFNHEIKYRSIISKLLIQNEHTIQDLRRNQSNLRILNERLNRMIEQLDRNLEKRQRDREAKRNVDIQRFTYVTFIFLPLGFATGLFSMSGAPTGKTLWDMFFTAIGAFAVVLILIFGYMNFEIARKAFWKGIGLAASSYTKKSEEVERKTKPAKGEHSQRQQGSRHSEVGSRQSERWSRSEIGLYVV